MDDRTPRPGALRRGLAGGLLLVLAFFGLQLGQAATASATPAAGAVAAVMPAGESRAEAIDQLRVVRESIDRTLALAKQGKAEEAFAEAKNGYLSHFEYVEIPLRIADAKLTADAETKFAEIRGLISGDASVDEVRAEIVELRGLIDDAERKLTDTGLSAPSLVFGQSFVIFFREGLEAVLLISVLLGYLEAAKATRLRKPILIGMGAAVVATIATFFFLQGIIRALPFGREVLEAVTALLAVLVLFYVSFWLIARMEQKRWLEFLRARVWTAVSAGSATALMLVGFTALYREGFETALFYQALVSFGPGLGWYILAGIGAAVAALVVVGWLIFALGRKIPIKAFLSFAVLMLMATSVAFLGNAVRSLQEADVIALHRWSDWPQAPIFVSQSVGYWPSRETMLAQGALTAVYLAGALYVFVVRPRRTRALQPMARPAAPEAAPTPAPAPAAPVTLRDPILEEVESTRRPVPAGAHVRVGVDVGGTFTKAVAFDRDVGAVVAEAIVPTTHDHPDGVAAGVVQVVARLAEQVGADRIELVTHSTTQAVNALLEGDVAKVGMIGMSGGGDTRKARKRTVDAKIELGAGKALATVTDFLEGAAFTRDGALAPGTAAATVARLQAAGAEAIAVAEAFAPDNLSNEIAVAAAAAALGLPVTTSAELTGLYGLELRAVTAAINASILPIAVRTAEVVGSGVEAAGIGSPVMVMRGDGGATDLEGFQRAPARTLYSGPAASVAGALRSTRIDDAVIVEVGGTSTNVAAVRRGRPALSYVQVASHATAIRALDVRVLGVAGGSMLRVRTGGGMRRHGDVFGVGPRSAHIAGLPYSCYLEPEALAGAVAELIAPRAGDPADYLVVRLADGRRAALTNTCAANALGVVEVGDYAAGNSDSARAAFTAAGALLGLSGEAVARRMLDASTDALCELVASVSAAHELDRPTIVAVGGGAGGLGRSVARRMGVGIVVPPRAEVISAVGDALSLIRAERERTFATNSSTDNAAELAQLIAEVEGEAVRAGAGPATLDIRVEHIPERGAVRVTATGAVGLSSEAVPGRPPADAATAREAAAERGYPEVQQVGQFWLCTRPGEQRQNRLAVLDQYADLVIDVRGEVLSGNLMNGQKGHGPSTGNGHGTDPAAVFARHTKRFGPMTVLPEVWVISGGRMMQVPSPNPATLAHDIDALMPAGTAPTAPLTVLIGRE
ncbi:MAG TPA: hydantoinase/oxoprolinase family protein [Sporichthya sp.]|nr:hydantoinase/oxoprolinase family protein [Sporichthya sp.]